MDKRNTDLWVYAVLIGIIILMSIIQSMLGLDVNQGQAMSWLGIVLVALLGVLGQVLASRCGFPSMLEQNISSAWRYWWPFTIGAVLGLVMVIIDLIAPLGTDIQTRFPDSVPVFVQAGLVEEIIVHLFLMSLLIWLFSVKLFRNRHGKLVFWVVSTGVAAAYWGLQASAMLRYFPEKFTPIFALQSLLVILVTISLGAYLFRKFGFLAAVSLRYGFYLVWHILWAGGIGAIQYFR